MRNIAIKYGFLTGLSVIIYFLLFYFFEKSSVRGLTATWSSMLIYVVGMFLAVFAVRKSAAAENSTLTFIKTAFIVWLITNAIYYTFFYSIMMYDAELLQMHQQLTHEGMLDYYGNDADQILAIKKKTLDEYTPTISGSFFKYVTGAIGGFILSVVISGIVRRIQ